MAMIQDTPPTTLEYRDPDLKRRYQGKKIPMNLLVESYLDEKVDIHGDLHEVMRGRHGFVNYQVTPEQLMFLVSKFVPQVLVHSKKWDHELVTGHYDRGNDFFEAFLAETMVYTSAYFTDPDQTLEEAQRQKLDLVARKI